MALARYVQPQRHAPSTRGLEWHLRFLQSEAGSTANLYDFVNTARIELDHFVRFGNLTASDASFYRALQREVGQFATKLNAEAARWVENTIPSAYDAGAGTHAPNVVLPRDALEALSRNSLGLIRRVGDDMRRDIRHSIAAGILTGLSGSELRARIVASGIGRDRWPSVEYRAGVIARTETMDAYNTGALDAMRANGAMFARWIISPDEAVCKLCHPLGGKVFKITAFVGDHNPYPEAPALPRCPRHPRCRCTIAAVYRDRDGKIIGARTAPTEPKTPAALAGEPAVLPPAAMDFAGALGALRNPFALSDPAFRQFWRSTELDPDRIGQLAALDNTVQINSFMRARYGATWEPKGKHPENVRRAIIEALERFRGVKGDWVTDSPYLKSIGQHGMIRPDLDPGVLGVTYADGRLAVDFNMLGPNGAYGPGHRLRISPDHPADEVVIHELAHSLHNRFGAHDPQGYPAAEFGGRKLTYAENLALSPEEQRAYGLELEAASAAAGEWKAGWDKARRASNGIAPEGAVDPVALGANMRAAIEYEKRRLAEALDPNSGWAGVLDPKTIQATITRYEKLLAGIEGTGKAQMYPTKYAMDSEFEDFAESVTMYMLDPVRLERYSPSRYNFLRDSVFGGIEFK